MKSTKIVLNILVLVTLGSNLITSKSLAQENTEVDLNQLSCREMLKMPGENKQLTLSFFHGLMTAKNNQMVVDSLVLGEVTDKIMDYCIDNPDEALITAFEQYR